jgi:hypothetical protein
MSHNQELILRYSDIIGYFMPPLREKPCINERIGHMCFVFSQGTQEIILDFQANNSSTLYEEDKRAWYFNMIRSLFLNTSTQLGIISVHETTRKKNTGFFFHDKSVILKTGADAEKIWEILKESAKEIQAQKIPYTVLHQNSNFAAALVLQQCIEKAAVNNLYLENVPVLDSSFSIGARYEKNTIR